MTKLSFAYVKFEQRFPLSILILEFKEVRPVNNIRSHLFQCLILRIKKAKPKVASNMQRAIQWTKGRA